MNNDIVGRKGVKSAPRHTGAPVSNETVNTYKRNGKTINVYFPQNHVPVLEDLNEASLLLGISRGALVINAIRQYLKGAVLP